MCRHLLADSPMNLITIMVLHKLKIAVSCILSLHDD